MINKEEALANGISEDAWNSSIANGYVLRRLTPRIHWELKEAREDRRNAIMVPIEILVSQISNTGHEEGIEVAVDTIMEGLDELLEVL